MSDYEMPLFEWYHIEVELERRREYVREAMVHMGSRIFQMSDQEMIDALTPHAEMTPISFYADREWVEGDAGTTDQLSLRIGYAGDDELWRLYPWPIERDWPLGEIFRGHLLLSNLGRDRRTAERIAHKRLEKIEVIVEDQREIIEAFDTSLPDFIIEHSRRLGRYFVANDA